MVIEKRVGVVGCEEFLFSFPVVLPTVAVLVVASALAAVSIRVGAVAVLVVLDCPANAVCCGVGMCGGDSGVMSSKSSSDCDLTLFFSIDMPPPIPAAVNKQATTVHATAICNPE